MNIAIVGDVHLSERNPRCRKDNFLQSVLNKLDKIAQDNDKVIILGDLFHIHTNSTQLFNTLFKFFNIRHHNKFICIPGNHDLFHNNLMSLDRTTIGSLYYTNAIDLKYSYFKIDNAEFEVSLVNKNLDNIPVDENNSKILLGHNFYEMDLSPKESFTKEEIKKLNYMLVFLGHDHKPYDEEFIGNSTLIRMGSLSRIDIQAYNKDRDIVYYRLDSNTLEYERVILDVQPVSECYIEEAFNKLTNVHRKQALSFVEIGEALAKFNKCADGSNSLDKTLIKLGATDKERDYIKYLHTLTNVKYF